MMACENGDLKMAQTLLEQTLKLRKTERAQKCVHALINTQCPCNKKQVLSYATVRRPYNNAVDHTATLYNSLVVASRLETYTIVIFTSWLSFLRPVWKMSTILYIALCETINCGEALNALLRWHSRCLRHEEGSVGFLFSTSLQPFKFNTFISSICIPWKKNSHIQLLRWFFLSLWCAFFQFDSLPPR